MKEYIAKRVDSKMCINDPRWKSAETAELECAWVELYPPHYKTTAKLVHSNEGITVRLSTNEWPLTVTAMNFNDVIFEDSCMEFFFVPNTYEDAYLNIEVNPAAIARVGKGPGRPDRELLNFKGKIEIETSVIGEEGWSVMAFVPYSFLLEHYTSCDKEMRANFYKCGSKTVIRHYAAWNKVETPTPDYHRPEYFGRIILSDECIER